MGNSKPHGIFYLFRIASRLRVTIVRGLLLNEARAEKRKHLSAYKFYLLVLLYLIAGVPAARLSSSSAAVIPPKMASRNSIIRIQSVSTDFSVENVAGPPGLPLPVHVVVGPAMLSPDADRDEPAVNFSGFLDGCRLSAGTKRTRSWYVPINKLEGLMLVPHEGCEGDFSVLVMIYDGKEVRNDTRTILFSIHEGTDAASFSPPPAQPPSDAAPAVSQAEEEALLKKGAILLKNGDVSAARLNFENLALRGSAKGAYALAQSFDPAVLRSMEIAGLRPDLMKAKEWYARAAALGDQEAARRLSALNSVKLNGPPTQ